MESKDMLSYAKAMEQKLTEAKRAEEDMRKQ